MAVSRQLTQARIESIIDLCNHLCVDLQVTQQDLEIKPFSNGVDNEVYHVEFKCATGVENTLGEPLQSVAIKFFQDPSEDEYYDRMRALTNAILIGQSDLAPKVLLARENAMVIEFVKARHFSKKDDNDEEMFRLLAQKIARFNALQVPIPRNVHLKNMDMVFNKWIPREKIETDFYSGLRQDLDRLACVTFLEHNLNNTVDYIKELVGRIDQPVVYSHVDLNHFNILVLDQSREIRFIDFDYSSYHMRGYDLGRYFVDCESDEVFDDHEFVGDQKMLRFIDHYIDECCVIHGSQYRDNPLNSREKILRESKVFVLYSSLVDVLFCVWLAIDKEDIREKFLKNGEARYKAMVQAMKRFQEDGSFE